MATAPTPARGEIWLIDFDPSVGSETQKVRPALVVSLDSIGRLPLRLVVPITDWKPQFAAYPWFTLLPPDAANGLTKDSGADAFQTKSVSLSRFVRPLGVVTAAQLDAVTSGIACASEPRSRASPPSMLHVKHRRKLKCPPAEPRRSPG